MGPTIPGRETVKEGYATPYFRDFRIKSIRLCGVTLLPFSGHFFCSGLSRSARIARNQSAGRGAARKLRAGPLGLGWEDKTTTSAGSLERIFNLFSSRQRESGELFYRAESVVLTRKEAGAPGLVIIQRRI